MEYKFIYLNVVFVRFILVAAGCSCTYSFSFLCSRAFHYMNTPQFFLIHSILAIMKNVALKILIYVSWSPGIKLQGSKSSCNRTVSHSKCFFWSALPPAALRAPFTIQPYYRLEM